MLRKRNILSVARPGNNTSWLAAVLGSLCLTVFPLSIPAGETECISCQLGPAAGDNLGNGLRAMVRLDFPQHTLADNDGRDSVDPMRWHDRARNTGRVFPGTGIIGRQAPDTLDPYQRSTAPGSTRGVQLNMHLGGDLSDEEPAGDIAGDDGATRDGLTISASYARLPVSDLDDSSYGKVEEEDGYAGGISYQNAGLLVFADYIATTADHDDKTYKFGGSYTLNNVAVMGEYEVDTGLVSDELPVGSDEVADSWMLGGSLKLGSSTLSASYGRARRGELLGDYSTFSLTGTHALGKRTRLFAGYSAIDCNNRDANTCSDIAREAGDDERVSFGMKHNF